MKVSWQWLAGFYDGEGSITIYDYKRLRTLKDRPDRKGGTWLMNEQVVRLSIDQNLRFYLLLTQKNNPVLELIRGFLAIHGIKTRPVLTSKTGCGKIQIQRYQDVKAFLEGVLPYLICKREKALIALAFINKKWYSKQGVSH